MVDIFEVAAQDHHSVIRWLPKRMAAKTIEVKASHVSLISQPETIANLILEAAG